MDGEKAYVEEVEKKKERQPFCGWIPLHTKKKERNTL